MADFRPMDIENELEVTGVLEASSILTDLPDAGVSKMSLSDYAEEASTHTDTGVDVVVDIDIDIDVDVVFVDIDIDIDVDVDVDTHVDRN